MTKNKRMDVAVQVAMTIGAASVVAVILNAVLNLWDRVF